MSENYTVEDFARATLATRGAFEVARRMGLEDGAPWRVHSEFGLMGQRSDERMARDGWTPVVESRITEHALLGVQGNARQKVQKMVDHIADQDRVIRRRNDEIAVLRRELADAQAPLSLDRLEAEWDNAESADACREDDLLIHKRGEGTFVVEKAPWGFAMPSSARILSRAPRKPWQDLADVISEYTYQSEPEALAQALHRQGVRVTGGDDDE